MVKYCKIQQLDNIKSDIMSKINTGKSYTTLQLKDRVELID